jgi:hypothetical protein
MREASGIQSRTRADTEESGVRSGADAASDGPGCCWMDLMAHLWLPLALI